MVLSSLRVLRVVVVFAISFLLQLSRAHACDVCAFHSAIDAQGLRTHGFTLGVAEQFTSLTSSAKPQSSKPLNNEYIDSSVTQVIGSYQFSSLVGLQFSLPYINRNYRQIIVGNNQKGTVSGLGDMSVMAQLTPLRLSGQEYFFVWQVGGGLKLPTGDAHRLSEEQPGSEESSSLIGGEDLALGSGSVDGVLSTAFFGYWNRFAARGFARYVARREGSYQYRYGDDVLVELSPGMLLALNDDYTFSVHARFLGQFEQRDSAGGVKLVGTDGNTVLVGPQLRFTRGNSMAALLGVGFPLYTESSASRLTPTYQVQASLSYNF